MGDIGSGLHAFFVNIFIRAIGRLIEDDLTTDMYIFPDAVAAMKKFQHKAAIAKADFSTSYAADAGNCVSWRVRFLLLH